MNPPFPQGKIGVNTDSAEEALTVVGNVQLTGQILQPSDMRLKTDIMKVAITLHKKTNVYNNRCLLPTLALVCS